jgi:hypothetical protein
MSFNVRLSSDVTKLMATPLRPNLPPRPILKIKNHYYTYAHCLPLGHHIKLKLLIDLQNVNIVGTVIVGLVIIHSFLMNTKLVQHIANNVYLPIASR